jgi:hypothetical protein
MRYERPRIVRRELIAALQVAPSNGDTFTSDASIKDNVLPLSW